MTDLAAAHAATTVDLGTGDGRFVLAHAAAHPERLVLGIDASQDAMAEASRRAARPAARGGAPNALFVAAALEAMPPALDGLADLVTVNFPWGSLRSAAAGHDPALLDRLTGLLAGGGRLELLLADADRDSALTRIDPEAVVRALEARELRAVEARVATLADAVAAHSSWGKRLLGHPAPGRTAWRIRLERPSSVPPTRG